MFYFYQYFFYSFYIIDPTRFLPWFYSFFFFLFINLYGRFSHKYIWESMQVREMVARFGSRSPLNSRSRNINYILQRVFHWHIYLFSFLNINYFIQYPCWHNLWSNMFGEEGQEQLIHLLRELLLCKMGSFRQECDLQIGDICFCLSTSYVLLPSWEFEAKILFTHDEQHWNFNFWVCYVELLVNRPNST